MNILYMQIPILLPGNDGEEEKEVTMRIMPDEISCYYPGYHFGTFIYTKGGGVYLTKHKVEDIDYNIDKYWKAVSEIQNKRQTIIPTSN